MPTGEDPKVKVIVAGSKSPVQDNLDMRDFVHYLVGSGITSPAQSPDAKAAFSRIAVMKGLPFAQQLFNHISLFNQSNKSTNPEDRINQFYTIGAPSNPDIQNLINGFKGLGGKPVTTDSHFANNVDLGMGVADVPPPQPKIMVKVKK